MMIVSMKMDILNFRNRKKSILPLSFGPKYIIYVCAKKSDVDSDINESNKHYYTFRMKLFLLELSLLAQKIIHVATTTHQQQNAIDSNHPW